MLMEGIVALISGNAAMTAIIKLRLFPLTLPPEQTTFPCLTYQKVTDVPEYSLDSKQTGMARIQFDAYGSTYSDSAHVLKALYKILDAYQGRLTDADATLILSALRVMGIDNFENDSRIYRSIAEYEVMYLEP